MNEKLTPELWKGLAKRQAGKYVAVVNGEIAAIGDNEVNAFKTAKAKHPDKLISIRYIPRKDEQVTLL